MPYTITPIEITAINECPHCGIETEFVSSSSAHALNEWLVDNYCVALEDVARGYSEARDGFTWKHGRNYEIADSDLLGGSGDGTRAHKASTVFQFIYDDADDKTEQTCDHCALYM